MPYAAFIFTLAVIVLFLVIGEGPPDDDSFA